MSDECGRTADTYPGRAFVHSPAPTPNPLSPAALAPSHHEDVGLDTPDDDLAAREWQPGPDADDAAYKGLVRRDEDEYAAISEDAACFRDRACVE